MPRISASTVAEHRERQRTALLAAARELLLDGGYTAISFGALATRTGLARPTVYSYFRTRDDLVVALCEAEFPFVAADIDQAVARAHTPRDRLVAYVRAQLRAAQDSRYRIAHALMDAPLADEARRRIVSMHKDLVPSAAAILAELGHQQPALTAGLLQGLINGAVFAMDAGQPARRVVKATVDAVINGFTEPVRNAGPTEPTGSAADQ